MKCNANLAVNAALLARARRASRLAKTKINVMKEFIIAVLLLNACTMCALLLITFFWRVLLAWSARNVTQEAKQPGLVPATETQEYLPWCMPTHTRER